jgi:hypothetical protein
MEAATWCTSIVNRDEPGITFAWHQLNSDTFISLANTSPAQPTEMEAALLTVPPQPPQVRHIWEYAGYDACRRTLLTAKTKWQLARMLARLRGPEGAPLIDDNHLDNMSNPSVTVLADLFARAVSYTDFEAMKALVRGDTHATLQRLGRSAWYDNIEERPGVYSRELVTEAGIPPTRSHIQEICRIMRRYARNHPAVRHAVDNQTPPYRPNKWAAIDVHRIKAMEAGLLSKYSNDDDDTPIPGGIPYIGVTSKGFDMRVGMHKYATNILGLLEACTLFWCEDQSIEYSFKSHLIIPILEPDMLNIAELLAARCVQSYLTQTGGLNVERCGTMPNVGTFQYNVDDDILDAEENVDFLEQQVESLELVARDKLYRQTMIRRLNAAQEEEIHQCDGLIEDRKLCSEMKANLSMMDDVLLGDSMNKHWHKLLQQLLPKAHDVLDRAGTLGPILETFGMERLDHIKPEDDSIDRGGATALFHEVYESTSLPRILDPTRAGDVQMLYTTSAHTPAPRNT